jgi:hypothetical protein
VSSVKDLSDWLGNASDAVEAAINLGQESTEQDRIDQWSAEGREAGAAKAEAEYESGDWRMNPINEVEMPTDPGIAPGSTFDPVELPSFANPVLTALEVAFTPSELNVGEFAHRDAFSAGEADGYRQGMFDAFDQALEKRFELPPPEPVPEAPSLFESLVPQTSSPTIDSSDPGPATSNSDLGSGWSSESSGPDGGTGSFGGGGSDGRSGGGSDSGSGD